MSSTATAIVAPVDQKRVSAPAVQGLPHGEDYTLLHELSDTAAVCATVLAAPVVCCAMLVLGVSKTVYDNVLH
eukprot:170242-Chlamydomonas_euryale.AAC.15